MEKSDTKESVISEVIAIMIFIFSLVAMWKSFMTIAPDVKLIAVQYIQRVTSDSSTIENSKLIATLLLFVSFVSISVGLVKFYLSFLIFDISNKSIDEYLSSLKIYQRIIEWTLRFLILFYMAYAITIDLFSTYIQLDPFMFFSTIFKSIFSNNQYLIFKYDIYTKILNPWIFISTLYIMMLLWTITMTLFLYQNISPRVILKRFGSTPFFGLIISLSLMFFYYCIFNGSKTLPLILLLWTIVVIIVYLVLQAKEIRSLYTSNSIVLKNYFKRGIYNFEKTS